MYYQQSIVFLLFNFVFVRFQCSVSGYDASELFCLPGIKTFSTGDSNTYFECAPGEENPVLKHCPQDYYYSTQDETCRAESQHRRRRRNAGGSNTDNRPRIINQKVLGQDVSIGDLYDAREAQYFSGTSLWSTDTLDKVKLKNRNDLNSDAYRFKTGKTTAERLEIMDIKAELKLSFLGGLVTVTGGAAFARKDNVLETDETFTLIYKARAYSDRIPKSTPIDFSRECGHKYATHVVNKIEYGQNAYFFFKHAYRLKKESQKVEGNLEVVVKSIPSFSIEGKASINLKGKEKDIADSTEVQFDGDFVFTNGIPTTFDAAVKVFKDLPKLRATKPNYENAVPQIVQLTPLVDYCSKKDAILVSIGDSIITAVSNALEGMETLATKVRTLLRSQSAIRYSAVRTNLLLYKTHLENYQLQFKGKLQKLLPAIRGKSGGKSETDLVGLLSGYMKTPMNLEKSKDYLIERALEIRAIAFLMKGFDTSRQENFDVADYKKANAVNIILNFPSVVTFSVNILLKKSVTESFLAGISLDESGFWYKDSASIGKLGKEKSLFREFAKANKNKKDCAYLIKINERINKQPVNVFVQRGGKIDPKPFITPSQPAKPGLIGKAHNSFTIKVNDPKNDWINKIIVSFWKLSEGEQKSSKKYFAISRSNAIIINGLDSLTFYQYRVMYSTEFGVSPSSEICEVTTTPCSPPSNLKFQTKSDASLKVSWETPVSIGKGVSIKEYKVLLHEKGTIIQSKTIENEKRVQIALFANLEPRTKYTIEVVATIKSSKIESLPATISGYTSPKPPLSLNLVKANLNAITLKWSTPPVAKGATVSEFIVKYTRMTDDGSKTIPGFEKTQSASKQNNIKVIGLVQGSNYGFSVKIITSLGKSKFSNFLIARTKQSKTELQKLRDSIKQQFVVPLINELEKKVNKRRTKEFKSLENQVHKQGITLRKERSRETSTIYDNFGRRYNTIIKSLEVLQDITSSECVWQSGDGMYKKDRNHEITAGYGFTRATCLAKCRILRKKNKSINGVSLKLTGGKCFCERKMDGRNSDLNFQSCVISG